MYLTDTIRARSESDADSQISRLYPTALDIELEDRTDQYGNTSRTGQYFTYRIELEDDEEFDLPEDGDLGEEEY